MRTSLWIFVVLSVGQAHGQELCAQIKALTAGSQAHWGVSVTTLEGAVLCGWNEGQLFRPASNAKVFTTIAALDLLGPGSTVKTTVSANGTFAGTSQLTGKLYLSSEGDANLSGRAFPYTPHGDDALPPLHSLEELATQIAATGLKQVDGDVVGVGDPLGLAYPNGWSLDDLAWGYGAPVSLLSVDDNQLAMTLTPASEVGSRALLQFSPEISYYTVTNDVMTVEAGTSIGVERLPGSKQLRVYGRIGLKAAPDQGHISIDDPAEFAAIALKQMLEQHGVTVTGRAYASHAPLDDARSFRSIALQPLDLAAYRSGGTSVGGGAQTLAVHVSRTLLDDVIATNKESLNLHAEILLRRLGAKIAAPGQNASAEGARVVHQFLMDSGVRAGDVSLVDGSGLSAYDLVTPRSLTVILGYAAQQPWFGRFKASLPVGGVDGTLAARFPAALKGKVFAKTGTLGQARALSGYVTTASGRTLVFSILEDSRVPGSGEDVKVSDQIVTLIAAFH